MVRWLQGWLATRWWSDGLTCVVVVPVVWVLDPALWWPVPGVVVPQCMLCLRVLP